LLPQSPWTTIRGLRRRSSSVPPRPHPHAAYQRNEPHGRYIGYKGGIVERNLLQPLRAKHTTDIAVSFGVPKFDDIVQEPRYLSAHLEIRMTVSTTKETRCSRHKKSRGKLLHCPLTEVCIFAAYLAVNFPKKQV